MHTLDEQRKELMIIYSEAFSGGGKATTEEARAAEQRAQRTMEIEPV